MKGGHRLSSPHRSPSPKIQVHDSGKAGVPDFRRRPKSSLTGASNPASFTMSRPLICLVGRRHVSKVEHWFMLEVSGKNIYLAAGRRYTTTSRFHRLTLACQREKQLQPQRLQSIRVMNRRERGKQGWIQQAETQCDTRCTYFRTNNQGIWRTIGSQMALFWYRRVLKGTEGTEGHRRHRNLFFLFF